MGVTTDDDVLHGLARLEGTRVSVLHVYEMVVEGDGQPAAVADALDLSVGDVYEALAYYYNNPEEMRRQRAREDEAREAVRERAVKPPAEPDTTG
jgi:uncharacterized protein (DUF433 family)